MSSIRTGRLATAAALGACGLLLAGCGKGSEAPDTPDTAAASDAEARSVAAATAGPTPSTDPVDVGGQPSPQGDPIAPVPGTGSDVPAAGAPAPGAAAPSSDGGQGN